MVALGDSVRVLGARNAVSVTFILNGFLFASWISRIPEVRDRLELTNGQLGSVLLVIAVGSLTSLPTTGWVIERWGAAFVMRLGASAAVIGLILAAVGAGLAENVGFTCLGLFWVGLGIGAWDVAMNVEGAAVERLLQLTIMPRFHAGFSLGTVLGAAVGAVCAARDLPLVWHLAVVGCLGLAGAWWWSHRFLPARYEHEADAEPAAPPDPGSTQATKAADKNLGPRSAWLEPRTLMIGLLVCSLAVAEGTANDWLAIALIDGYDARHWVGVVGFGLFVSAMTTGRMIGPLVLDRWGRVPVLWSTMIAAGTGVLLIVWGGHPAVAAVGILIWGLGASLGFPVGMSAAADEKERAAARVSVVSTIAYTAFLAGPPLLGYVGDQVGSLRALLVVAVLLVPCALLVPATRKPS